MMKRTTIYTHLLTLALLCLTVLAACNDDEPVAWEAGSGVGLYVSVAIDGEKSVGPTTQTTRADQMTGEDSWGENAVSSVDYFLFDVAGNRLLYQRHTPSDTEDATLPTTTTTEGNITYYTTQLCALCTGSDWTSLYEKLTAGCRLYAIVNLSEEVAKTVTDLASLQALVVTDADIYKRDADKRFLMDGKYTFTGNEGYAANRNYTLTLDVCRAAAKVKVNISKGSGWTAYDNSATIGTITASVRNYAGNTRVTADGTPLTTTTDADKLVLKSVTHTTSGIVAEGTRADNYLGSITFYTFAHDWTENPAEETSLELNVPYTGRESNYYKLVFLPNGGTQLERNTFYEVDVTIRYDGSEQSSDPVELEAKTWRVTPWATEEFDVVEQTKVDYLILSDYYIDLRNENQTSITCYSSDVVTVELVGFADEDDIKLPFNANQETTVIESLTSNGFKKYEGHAKEGMDDIPAIYYVNKDNERIDITQDPKANYGNVDVVSYAQGSGNKVTSIPDGHEVYVTWANNVATQGTIDIFSNIPLNVTPRYITLKVTMKTRQTDGEGNPVYLTRYAVVKQYPLEYINGREGMLSYMESKTKKKDNPDDYYEYSCPCPSGTMFLEYDDGTTNSGYTSMEVPQIIREYFNGKVEGTETDYHVGVGANMKCKFYIPYEDTDEYGNDWSKWKSKYGHWTDAEGTHYGRIYRIDDRFVSSIDDYDNNRKVAEDDIAGLMDNGVANNNRMYEVVVTATSTQYRISRPLMENITDDDGNAETADNLKVAVSSEENNSLLSPRFMLASQLGNNSAVNYWETARDQCKKYVEIGRDGKVYDDWRLPTIAELQIVKNYQIDEDVYDITMNKVLNSDGDTNPCYWTAQEDVFVYTTGAGQAACQTYSIQITQISYKNTTLEATESNTRITRVYKISEEVWNSKGSDYQNGGYADDLASWTLASTKEENGKKPKDGGHTADGIYYTMDGKKPDLAIRVRCVRDVKVEEVEIYD